ncbi:MAG: hypothetical protein IPP12_04595 [Nitrospira sp.]|nr:hypothetical protein [Nitrospira sp.]
MRTFWHQSLLIGIAIVAVGCVGPQANMSVEERLLTDGYPAEYIDGLNAGCEAFCRELLADKIQYPSTPLEISITCRNLAAKVEQKPKTNRSHQQGWADGKALMSLAATAARNAEAQLQMQLQAGSDYMKYQRNMELLKLNK